MCWESLIHRADMNINPTVSIGIMISVKYHQRVWKKKLSHKTEALGKEPVPLRRIWECLQTRCFQINLSVTKHLLYPWQWYPEVYEKDTYLSSMFVWYDVSKVLCFWKHHYPWHLGGCVCVCLPVFLRACWNCVLFYITQTLGKYRYSKSNTEIDTSISC